MSELFEHGMIVQVDEPPMMDEIDRVFHVRGKPVIFAWGDTIYNPMRVPIPRQLMVHEAVHGLRQAICPGGIEGWWERYLVDAEFRYAEELIAHQEEYAAFCALHKDRNTRAAYLQKVARKLCSPLYGKLVTYTDAKKAIESYRRPK